MCEEPSLLSSSVGFLFLFLTCTRYCFLSWQMARSSPLSEHCGVFQKFLILVLRAFTVFSAHCFEEVTISKVLFSVCMRVEPCAWHGAHVEVRRKLVGIGSLLPCGVWGWRLDLVAGALTHWAISVAHNDCFIFKLQSFSCTVDFLKFFLLTRWDLISFK